MKPDESLPVADLNDRRDAQLLEQVAAGDETAFRELFRRYAPAALGLAKRVLGDHAMAEEVVQDVFLAVWRTASRYDGARGTPRTWLFTQVHHRAVDVVRREEAERRRLTSPIQLPDAPRDADDIVEDDWLSARRGLVREALEVLQPEQRQVIELAYFNGMTQTQVAEQTGLPLGTVKSRTLAGMKQLRGRLSGAVQT